MGRLGEMNDDNFYELMETTDWAAELAGCSTDEIISAKREAKKIADVIKKFDKTMGEELVTRMCAGGEIDHVTADGGLKAKLLTGRSADRIDGQLLATHGVPVETITLSTIPGEEYVYVRIDAVKGGTT